MTTAAEYFQVDPLSAWAYPLSYRYRMRAPWGETQQVLTVDAPTLGTEQDAAVALGVELWRRVIAPAITSDVELTLWETVIWRALPFPFAMPAAFTYGLLQGPASSRSRSGCVVMHTGHTDDLARRRLFLPGIPADWVQGGKLTFGARDALETWGLMIGAGLASHLTQSPMTLLIAYPELLVPDVDNPPGVAFRRVKWLRGCEHTERAPELSGVPWP